jgi:hypothetical protein
LYLYFEIYQIPSQEYLINRYAKSGRQQTTGNGKQTTGGGTKKAANTNDEVIYWIASPTMANDRS